MQSLSISLYELLYLYVSDFSVFLFQYGNYNCTGATKKKKKKEEEEEATEDAKIDLSTHAETLFPSTYQTHRSIQMQKPASVFTYMSPFSTKSIYPLFKSIPFSPLPANSSSFFLQFCLLFYTSLSFFLSFLSVPNMKLLPSPSISSSSSNAMSFDSNVCTSKRATASCLSGIFSRLLCSRGLPTHPSDQITDTTWMSLPCDIKQEHCVKSFEAPATDPGIVAKLMGLEAFPDHATSILRSRSMNSVELSNQKTGQHRRAKSTSSFHELTAFLEPENEQFFVLTFGKRGDKKETRPEERQSGEGFGEVRQKRREKRKIMRKGNEKKVLLKTKEHKDAINEIVMRVVDREQLTERISEMPYQEMAHSSKTYSTDSALPLRDLGRQVNAASDLQELTRKREKSLRCEQVEFSSEESSPVSTLDFDKFVLDPGAPTSEEYATCWRRKLSSRLEDYDGFMDENVNNGDDPNSKRREESSKHEMSMVGVGEMGESIWTHKRVWKFEDFEDINTDFGLQILNELLDELVDQLA